MPATPVTMPRSQSQAKATCLSHHLPRSGGPRGCRAHYLADVPTAPHARALTRSSPISGQGSALIATPPTSPNDCVDTAICIACLQAPPAVLLPQHPITSSAASPGAHRAGSWAPPSAQPAPLMYPAPRPVVQPPRALQVPSSGPSRTDTANTFRRFISSSRAFPFPPSTHRVCRTLTPHLPDPRSLRARLFSVSFRKLKYVGRISHKNARLPTTDLSTRTKVG